MKNFNHSLCNDTLYAPKGEEEACDDLDIQRGYTTYGVEPSGKPRVVKCVVSYWKPTPEELALLNANGSIQFCAIGTNHPPISLDVAEN